MPLRFNLDNRYVAERVVVSIHEDGSVTVEHSGIEVGQGINTKIVQAVSMQLSATASLGMDAIVTLEPKSTNTYAFATPTWSSTTSEGCVLSVIEACSALNARLAPFVTPGDTWQNVIDKAVVAGVDLSAAATRNQSQGGTYWIYGACASSVELDVLTGEIQILTADIYYDGGISLNPAVDIGQVEGSFVQGLGMCLLEENVRSSTDGRLVSNGTWDYKPPSVLCIPISMNTTFIPGDNKRSANVMGSKASGEPAYMLGACPFFALKQAIYAARAELGKAEYFRLDCPATPDRAQQACM
jgi:xanthine dehydrogenase/oxidase